MGWMGSLVNGLAGNLNEISPQETEKEFGAFLMEGETVQACFRLVRDVLIVTDKRIIDIDKQGATGASRWRQRASAWTTARSRWSTSFHRITA